MGPRLAPLALLLLALCGSLSQSAPTPDRVTAAQKKVYDLIPPARFEEVNKQGPFGPVALTGATLWLMFPEAQKTAANAEMATLLDNGVLCTLEKTSADDMKKLIYGAAPLTTEQKAAEKAIAADMGLVCDGNTSTDDEVKCFCTENKIVLWCAGLKWKRTKAAGHTKTKCAADAYAALKIAAPTLAKTWDFSGDYAQKEKTGDPAMTKLFGDGNIDAMIKDASEEISKYYCESLNPAAEAAVADLMASDLAYKSTEAYVMALGIAAAVKTPQELAAAGPRLQQACTSDEPFKKSTFGKCTCEGKHGFIFCAIKALAEELKAIGYLDCTNHKFVASKKPTSIKLFGDDKKAPPGAPAGGKGRSAAASLFSFSLLLAPLAAVMLRH